MSGIFMETMSNKLEKLKEKHEIEEYNLQVEDSKNRRLRKTLMFLGGIHTVQKIANSLKSHEIRAIQAIESEKLYLDIGFETFADFLNSEESPVSKSLYYERIKILEKEGDARFDLLNEIGIAQTTRKLLAAGNYDAIEIDGDRIRIGDEEADLSNVRMVRGLIESYAADLKRLNDENSKTKQKLEKAETKVNDLSESLNREQNRKPTDLDAHSSALMNLLAAFQVLKTEAANLTIVEKEQFAPRTFETIARQLDGLSNAYGRTRKDLAEMSDEEREKYLASKINDDELADLMD